MTHSIVAGVTLVKVYVVKPLIAQVINSRCVVCVYVCACVCVCVCIYVFV